MGWTAPALTASLCQLRRQAPQTGEEPPAPSGQQQIAFILRLASGSKKQPASEGDGLEQIKLVAGTRNHREFTIRVRI